MSSILLIHGAWGGAWELREIVASLKERRHRAWAIDLPGHGQRPAPISKVTMDAYVTSVIDAVRTTEGKVVLAGHSLAGSVISQVAEEIPQKIESLVYICAMLPRNGETPLGLMQSDDLGELLPKLVFSDDRSFATVEVEDVRNIFLHDVKEKERLEELAPMFAVEQAVEPFMAPARLTGEAFGAVPKSYIRCSLDKVLSPALQDRMISGWDVERVFRLDSGHFPLMSMPERLIDAISESTRAPVSALRP